MKDAVTLITVVVVFVTAVVCVDYYESHKTPEPVVSEAQVAENDPF